MASPRACREGNREVEVVEGKARDESEEMALDEGGCRASIVRGGCAQLSDRTLGIKELEL